jgi:hypothetical protein
MNHRGKSVSITRAVPAAARPGTVGHNPPCAFPRPSYAKPIVRSISSARLPHYREIGASRLLHGRLDDHRHCGPRSKRPTLLQHSANARATISLLPRSPPPMSPADTHPHAHRPAIHPTPGAAPTTPCLLQNEPIYWRPSAKSPQPNPFANPLVAMTVGHHKRRSVAPPS